MPRHATTPIASEVTTGPVQTRQIRRRRRTRAPKGGTAVTMTSTDGHAFTTTASNTTEFLRGYQSGQVDVCNALGITWPSSTPRR